MTREKKFSLVMRLAADALIEKSVPESQLPISPDRLAVYRENGHKNKKEKKKVPMKVFYRDFEFKNDEYKIPRIIEFENSFVFDKKYEFEDSIYFRLENGLFRVLNKYDILRYEE